MTDIEKIEELSQKISAGLKEIFLSENFIKFLQSVALFHHYSLRNLLLIRMQLPTATRVAEYEEWKQLDRYVKRGEKGIAIVKPRVTTFRQTEEENKTVIQYALTRVYDISQTEGKPVPETQKDLQADNEQLFQIFQKRSPYKVSFLQTDGEEKCRCNYTTQTISIKLGLTDKETVQALIRGVCHAILYAESGKELKQKKIESECVALLITHSLGFDISIYNLDFVAEWSKTAQLDELYQTLENIQRIANQIMKSIQEEIESFEKIPEKGDEKSQNLQSRLQAAAEKVNDLRNEKELNAVEKSLLK